jgi:hypothetical protein
LEKVRGINKLIILPMLAVLIINMAAIVPVRAAVPPTEYLYVDGFDATKVDWTEVGTSPYLNAPGDGNYIEGTTDAAQERWFTFEDIAPLDIDAAIDKVWLEGYTNGPYDTGVDFDVYNAGFDWLGSLYANDSPQWVNLRWVAPGAPTSDSDASLLSESGLNGFKCLVYFYDPGGAGGLGNIVDALRLLVTYKEKPLPPYPFMMVSPAVSTAGVGETFAIDIVIAPLPYTPIYDLYGFEFKVKFNPAVVQAVVIGNGGFMPSNAIVWANVTDNTAGFAWFSLTMPFGAPKGVSGSGSLATITFTVMGVGACGFDIYDTLMGNRYATPIVHEIMNGFFANTADLAVSITTAHVETQKWSASGDADGLVGLTAAVKNDGAGITEAKARFTIYDESGLLVDAPESAPVSMAPHDMTSLAVSWGGWSLYSAYKVEVTVLYYTATGWVTGMKGSASGSRDVMVVHFRTQA